MKTFISKLVVAGRTRYLNFGNSVSKGMLIVIAMMCFMQTNGKENKKPVTISGSQFTYPLIERWIAEYSKINPDFKIQLGNNQNDGTQADLTIIAHTPEKEEIGDNKTLVKVGRYAILPITNEKNQLFSKELKKGIKTDRLKTIFLKEDIEDDPEKEAKEPEYTVYTKTPQSSAAIVISGFLGKPADELQGIYVTGDDKYLVSSVLEDSTSVSYNNLSLIYDLSKRTPLRGVKILPIDLNNNGRLDKEEQIYENIDQVITFLEASKKTLVPTDYLSFVATKQVLSSEVSDFVKWVKENGQQYNHQYGFLSNNERTSILSQK